MNRYVISQIETRLAAAHEECTAAIIAADMAKKAAIEANRHREQLETALTTMHKLTELGVRITDD